MSDNTTNRPAIQLSDLSDDTVIYRASKPRVRLFEIDVFDTIGSILKFRPSGLRVAREIIKRQGGENITVTLTDAEFAEALWLDLPESTRLSKLVRAKRVLKEDQISSGFQFIYKIPREHGMTKDGRHFSYPSKYKPGHYWDVSDDLQSRSDQVDFFALAVHKRRKVEREMLEQILDERGYKPRIIERKKSDAKEKEKKERHPCGCPCDACANCETKSATGSEANGRGALDLGRRVTKKDVGEEIGASFEALFETGVRWANLGLNTADYFRKLESELNILDQRLSDAIVRSNKARDVKPVGGQPK